MPFQEVVEAEGHLIDSHIMELIFDKVVEFHGRFEVEQFRIGRTNSDPSRLRLRVEGDSRKEMDRLLQQLLDLGCSPVDSGDAQLALIERDRCAPEDFYSTTNHRTMIRHQGEWIEVARQRMDALVVVKDGKAECRRLRDVKAGDMIVTGTRGIRVVPEPKERDRLDFAFMSNGISSERQVETAVRQTAALINSAREQGLRIVVVAGPVVVHTGGVKPLSRLIRGGFINALLSGNALGVHDIESALFGTSLGIRMEDGRQEEHGHRNHMRAINAIYNCGDIKGAVECGRLKSGIMYECVVNSVPFVLAGSLRDDGPLPDTITDMNAAQDAYNEQLRGAGVVLCLGSMLHAIATGNMLPAWVKIICVDINPAVATKVSDRGTGQAIGIVTDVGIFLEALAKELGAKELGAKDLGAKELGAKELGAKELGTKELGAKVLGAKELGTKELGAKELGAKELGAKVLGAKELGAKELGAKELGAKELGAKELGAKELGAKELGAKELGAKELGAKELGAKELGAKEVGGGIRGGAVL